MKLDDEDQLRGALAGIPAELPPDLVRAAYRRHRTRRATTAASAGALGAAAVTAIALTASAPGPAPATAAATPATVLVSHVTKALDALPAGTIVFVHDHTVPADAQLRPTDSWYAPGQSRTFAKSLTGQPVVDIWDSVTGTGHSMLVVDYRNQTWWKSFSAYPPASPPPPQPAAPSCSINSIEFNAPAMAQQIRNALACGELKDEGKAFVDGTQTVKLTGVQSKIQETFWVDTRTYLPVRALTVWLGTPGPDDQLDFQWLPPTPANSARLNVPIPAGFRHVPPQKSVSY